MSSGRLSPQKVLGAVGSLVRGFERVLAFLKTFLTQPFKPRVLVTFTSHDPVAGTLVQLLALRGQDVRVAETARLL
jgi:hypothetical protein